MHLYLFKTICFLQGLYQKAVALYTMGDFEFALVYYHRGHKLRPDLQEFRLGIQKAQEAIYNSVGSKSLETQKTHDRGHSLINQPFYLRITS